MGATTQGRPHAERLRSDLNGIRKELTETIKDLTPDDLNWMPNPDSKMRTIKDIIQEIGAMEAVTFHLAAYQTDLDWGTAMQTLDKDTVTDLLGVLSEIRGRTVAYLESVSEETLETPIPLNAEWQGYFNVSVIEPEELMRWLVRNEYYHLGQLITYQWQRGKNPNAVAG